MIDDNKKNKQKMSVAVKIWISVSSVLMILLLTATFVSVNVPFLYNTINSKFGGERYVIVKGNPEDYVYYSADYQNKKDTLNAANGLNEKICEEGFVLLKNEENALPLENEKNISVFGRNSVDIVIGGAGSNAGGVNKKDVISLYDSLSNVGFTYNPILKDFYTSDSTKRPYAPGMGSILTGFPIAETPISNYTSQVKDSYSQYNDAAIVVLSRIGGEGFDLPRTMFYNGSDYTTWNGNKMIPGARSKDDHYLQLDQNETDMLKEACDNFNKVIVVINSASPMELGFLDDVNHYAYSSKIKGAIWIGNPGVSGMSALGKILKGTVNPSGRTVDTYPRDLKKDPTWNNFGNNLREDGNRYYYNDKLTNAYFVEYQEGIYTGYHYYETRDYEEKQKGNNNWYAENVVYPFGYGLSYTKFKWEIESQSLANNTILNEDSEIDVSVKVTNIGDKAGKDVVQLYYIAPYQKGKIEKSQVVLGDFVKTKELQKDEFEVVNLKLKVRDMASYDYNDANGNNFRGYELDAGEYKIQIMKDAHTPVTSMQYSVAQGGIKYSKDNNTQVSIQNLFDDVSGHITNYLSREKFEESWPTEKTKENSTITKELATEMTYKLDDKTTDDWYSSEMPTQENKELSFKDTRIKLYELYGKDFKDEMWNKLLNQLTIAQMKSLCSKGNYRTVQINNIAKPLTTDADGPMGFTVFMGDPSIYDTCYYASECVIGATWNEELANKMGIMIGNEGLIGNEQGDKRPYCGWYAPAMNLHRSQFGGRNFEYYSEDPVLSSKMATMVVKGAKTKGVYTYCKHFALNEQETNRDNTGLVTWANEQSMREMYFKPFEMVVKEGETTAMMSSFNRLGVTWAGGNYSLLTKLLRDEWGFNGMVITDFNLKGYMNIDQMVRAGGDLCLSPGKSFSENNSATTVTALRKATKNILYTVVNSNATNGLGEGIEYKYVKPYWELFLIGIDCVVALGFGIWGFLVVKNWKRK